MTWKRFLIFTALMVGIVKGQQHRDLFNYGMEFRDENGANSFGQDEWDFLSCDDVENCPGYPNKYPFGYFSLEGDSQCRWCPDDGPPNSCGLHRQSPVDLKRNRAIKGHDDEKVCVDWHWMQYRGDSCDFDDMRNSFTIERHALQIHTPTHSNGYIRCEDENGRRYPRIDYSKGFPDWWYMARTDVSVPSQHTQDGRQYAAEITLAHFYEVDHFKNHLGHIGLFMQDYENEDPWPFLDKLICNWRLEEEKVREACGLPPAKPYGRCRLFRGQSPTNEWLVEAGLQSEEQQTETGEPSATSTTSAPSAAPSTDEPTSFPTEPIQTSAPTKEMEPFTSIPTVSTEVPTSIPTGAPESQFVRPPVVVLVPLGFPLSTSDGNVPSTTDSSGPADTPGVFTTPNSSPIILKPIIPVQSTNEPASQLVPEILEPTAIPTIFFTDDELFETTVAPSSAATLNPTAADSELSSPLPPRRTIPPRSNCRAVPFSLERFCEGNDPCCESVRSDSSSCWDAYDELGEAVESAGLPQTIMCSDVDNPHRMCKENSCCSNPRSTSSFCIRQYLELGDRIDEVCHYCCSKPREVGPSFFRQRKLRSFASSASFNSNSTFKEKDRVLNAFGKDFVLGEENFDEDEDENQFFDRVRSDFHRRSLQEKIHDVDYEDIEWFPYEWMLKVDTEYYFRYEGTMMVPPCWETVHWRVMKDPIRVHSRQIAELHRLLARRRDPDTCQLDTAGVRSSDGQRVKLNREVQYQTSIHRSVFCECPNWPSKFESDRRWCENHKEDVSYDRFYEDPYNFMVPP